MSTSYSPVPLISYPARLSSYLRCLLGWLGELPARRTVLPDCVAARVLSGGEHIDTFGAWLIHRSARDRDVRLSGANADAKRLIEVVGKDGQTLVARRPYVTP